jgi:hypothetical protein
MRKAFALSLIVGALFLAPAAASAAPLALSDHATVTKTVGDAGARVEQVVLARQGPPLRTPLRAFVLLHLDVPALLAPVSVPLLAVLLPVRRPALLRVAVRF